MKIMHLILMPEATQLIKLRPMKEKYEAWLTCGEAYSVSLHMEAMGINSKATYVRQALLAGAPRFDLEFSTQVGSLALALNRLTAQGAANCSIDASENEKIRRLVRNLIKAINKRLRDEGKLS